MNDKILGLSEEKLNGRIYTPRYIVENILNLSGYCGAAILNKNVVDNSCGNGAFLTVIAERYCTEFLKQSNNLDALGASLSEYIHGIEIDEGENHVHKRQQTLHHSLVDLIRHLRKPNISSLFHLNPILHNLTKILQSV